VERDQPEQPGPIADVLRREITLSGSEGMPEAAPLRARKERLESVGRYPFSATYSL
jgi:hypothetical protein